MHELSLCKGIIDIATRELAKLDNKPKQVLSVGIVVGKLHQIVEDNMLFIYSELVKGTVLDGSELDIKHVAVVSECEECGWSGEIRDSIYYCGNCSSGKLKIVKGKELYIENMEIDE